MPADTRLVQAVLSDDAEALRRLGVRMKCVPRMLRSLNARVGRPLDEHELADLSQEVLVVAWQKLETFEGKASLERWLYRIAYMVLMNAVRRARVRAVAGVGLEEDRVPDRERDPHAFEDLHRALERIPAEEADVLRLKHFEDATFDEIGERLGIPSGTAKTRYYRGRILLRQVLEPGGHEETHEHADD